MQAGIVVLRKSKRCEPALKLGLLAQRLIWEEARPIGLRQRGHGIEYLTERV
jgi:hypothetical protein